MKNLLFFIVLANYLSFLYSVIGVFKKTDVKFSSHYLALQALNLSFWIVSLYSIFFKNEVNFFSQIIFIFLYCLSLVLFWYTFLFVRKKNFSLAFHEHNSLGLVTDGPYRFIRNPFYSSYLFCYGVVVVYAQSVALSLIYVLIIYIYNKAAKSEEVNFLSSDHKNEYDLYFKKTKRFIPFLF